MDSLSAPANKPIVIAVDESADYRQLLRQVFTYFLPDYELRLLSSSQALSESLAGDEQPALVMMPGDLPENSLCEFLTQLRQHSQWQYVPIVVMSPVGRIETIQACYGAGANSFLIKPIGLDAMQQVLQSVCNYWLKLHQQVGFCI